MALGGYAAIVQRNIKRLMAYSSIANVGYILLGLAAASERGVQSVLIYLTIYLFMTGGAFAVILAMRRGRADVGTIVRSGRPVPEPADAGAGDDDFMFSLGGIPPLAGFIGKIYVFRAAIDAGNLAATATIANAFYVAAGLGAAISVVSDVLLSLDHQDHLHGSASRAARSSRGQGSDRRCSGDCALHPAFHVRAPGGGRW